MVLWASYSAGMGFGAGAALHEHPLLAVVVGVAGGVLLGLLLDRVIAVVHRRFLPGLPEPEVLDLEVDETGRWDPEDLEEEHARSAADAGLRALREDVHDLREERGRRRGPREDGDGEVDA